MGPRVIECGKWAKEPGQKLCLAHRRDSMKRDIEQPLTPRRESSCSAFPFDQLQQRQEFSNRIADVLINTKCDRRAKFTMSLTLGLLAAIMQIPPIFLHWVTIREPKPINQTNEKGEQLEVPFFFEVGYFAMCRYPASNLSELNVDESRIVADYPEICVVNPYFTGDDLSDFSFASNVVNGRLAIPGLLHLPGVVLCSLAVIFSIWGEVRVSNRTLHAAVLYVLGGLCLFGALLQVIAAVDDEMTPRMKPNAAGDPSHFTYTYSKSFLSASLSFLPLQICVYLQTASFFSRFPQPLDKAGIVPGLREMINEVIDRTRKGGPVHSNSGAPLSANSHRRESRCSLGYSGPAFGAIQQEVPRLAPPLTENVHRGSIQVYI
ncbi:unnamed protein product [Bursaphelenchus xylophilus]|uniref:(pine wood nematode) hypothetical protein n=1 Tax=Bursaphelenchus xylophilus TaxID=6326 RepID=A0A1I7RS04_BURXY|nr:unnamed protein product [Bursaphelenchus xylophilus]CAG9123345.1 unnamed protein product [Bursaphelenchus xylophilus]